MLSSNSFTSLLEKTNIEKLGEIIIPDIAKQKLKSLNLSKFLHKFKSLSKISTILTVPGTAK